MRNVLITSLSTGLLATPAIGQERIINQQVRQPVAFTSCRAGFVNPNQRSDAFSIPCLQLFVSRGQNALNIHFVTAGGTISFGLDKHGTTDSNGEAKVYGYMYQATGKQARLYDIKDGKCSLTFSSTLCTVTLPNGNIVIGGYDN